MVERPAGRFPAWGAVLALGVVFPAILSAHLEAQEPSPAQESATVADTVPVPLDTLQVVGSRVSGELPLRTRSVELLDRERIESLPARSVPELLEHALGVELLPRSDAQADLSIRGAGFEQVLVLVDGVRMNDPQTGHFALNLGIPLDEVERVEVLRGPASTQYGADAVGGVVNVVTRAGGGGSGASARVEGGSFSTARAGANAFHGAGVLRFRGGVEWSRSDGHREGTDHEILLARLRVGAPLAGGDAVVDGSFGLREFGAADFYAPFPSWEDTRARSLTLRWSGEVAPGLDVEPRFLLRSHDDDFILVRDDPGMYRNIHTSTQLGGEVVARYRPAAGVGVVAGVELFRNRLESTNLGDREEDRGAVFTEVALSGSGPVSFSAGVRADRHDAYGTFISPSVSAAYDVASPLRLRGSVGRSFRGGTFTERYYTDPVHQAREELDPERSWSSEVGADLSGPHGLTARTTLFLRSSSSLIDWALPAGVEEGEEPWETRNVDSAQFRGLELELSGLAPGELRWRGGVTLLSLRTEEEGDHRSKHLLRPMTEQLHFGVERSLGAGLSVSVRGSHERRKGEDSRLIWSNRAAVELPAGRLHLDLLNATDEEYLDVVGQPAAGRRVLAGYSLSW